MLSWAVNSWQNVCCKYCSSRWCWIWTSVSSHKISLVETNVFLNFFRSIRRNVREFLMNNSTNIQKPLSHSNVSYNSQIYAVVLPRRNSLLKTETIHIKIGSAARQWQNWHSVWYCLQQSPSPYLLNVYSDIINLFIWYIIYKLFEWKMVNTIFNTLSMAFQAFQKYT